MAQKDIQFYQILFCDMGQGAKVNAIVLKDLKISLQIKRFQPFFNITRQFAFPLFMRCYLFPGLKSEYYLRGKSTLRNCWKLDCWGKGSQKTRHHVIPDEPE